MSCLVVLISRPQKGNGRLQLYPVTQSSDRVGRAGDVDDSACLLLRLLLLFLLFRSTSHSLDCTDIWAE
jgi:hypothetical protein